MTMRCTSPSADCSTRVRSSSFRNRVVEKFTTTMREAHGAVEGFDPAGSGPAEHPSRGGDGSAPRPGRTPWRGGVAPGGRPIRSWRQQAADPDARRPRSSTSCESSSWSRTAAQPAAVAGGHRPEVAPEIIRGRRRQRSPDDDADEIGIRAHDPPTAPGSTIARQVGTSTISRLRSGRSSMSCDGGASTSTAREPLTNTRSGTATWSSPTVAGHVGEDGGEDVDGGGEVGRPLADRRAVVDAPRCAGGASPTGAVRIPNAASTGRWSSLSHRRQRASIAAAVSAVSYSTPTSQPSTSRLIVPAHTGRCA